MDEKEKSEIHQLHVELRAQRRTISCAANIARDAMGQLTKDHQLMAQEIAEFKKIHSAHTEAMYGRINENDRRSVSRSWALALVVIAGVITMITAAGGLMLTVVDMHQGAMHSIVESVLPPSTDDSSSHSTNPGSSLVSPRS